MDVYVLAESRETAQETRAIEGKKGGGLRGCKVTRVRIAGRGRDNNNR